MGNSENIVLGRGDISIGVWTTAGGSPSFTALGHSQGPVTIENSWEDYAVKSEQQLGALAKVPTSYSVKVKFIVMESILENWRIALRLLAAQKTGTPPNFLLAVTDPTEVYHQVKIVGKPVRSALNATGPNPGFRTINFWKSIIESVEPIALAKDQPQLLAITMDVCFDESITGGSIQTKGNYYLITDSAIG